jgi:hypothetical protein
MRRSSLFKPFDYALLTAFAMGVVLVVSQRIGPPHISIGKADHATHRSVQLHETAF